MKAQVSFEFIMSIAIGMIVVLALIVLFSNKLHEVVTESRAEQVEVILSMIENEVVFAKGAIPGYTRQFTLPVTIEGDNYSINLTDGTIAISYTAKDFTKGFSYFVNGSLCLDNLNESTKIFEVKRTATEVTLSSCPDCIPDFYDCNYYDEAGLCSTLDADILYQCQKLYCLCKG